MKKIILIVEDYEDARGFLKYILETSGYIVLEAANGKEAIDIVKKQDLDIILMDLSMPVMDGYTATKIIRESKEMPDVPIIALTAFGENAKERVMKAGCNQLISKPIDFEILETALNKYL